MPHRTDAAGQFRLFAWYLVLAAGAGCATLARRDPPPRNDPPPTAAKAPPPPPALANTPTLAITTPSQAPAADVKPTSARAPVPTPPAPAPESDPLRRLARDAAAAYAKHGCYIARLRRREFVQGKQKPEEVLIFKFRERPYSVHFKWLGEEGKGREVVYVRGQGDDKLHILTAAGDIPFAPAGRRLDLSPDSLLVRSASRYPITEAGIGAMITRFGRTLDAAGRPGGEGVVLKYVGPVQRPEYGVPLEEVECQFPPGREPDIPQGGRRLVFFDSATKFPVLSMTYDTAGREVDYYCFDRFQLDVHLDDDDFRPEKLWGPVSAAPKQ
jgi:Protein of unknown function (DUF1571)